MCQQASVFTWVNRLVGLVAKTSASRTADLGFDSHLPHGDFSRLSHTSDLKLGTPLATLPGTWHHRVNAGTTWPGVSILWLGEVESLICNFYLSEAARTIVWADPFLRYTCMLLGCYATCTQQTTITWVCLNLASAKHTTGSPSTARKALTPMWYTNFCSLTNSSRQQYTCKMQVHMELQ